MPTFTMPSLPGLDFSKLDLSKLQLPKFDLVQVRPRNIDLSKLDLRQDRPAEVDATKVDVPKIDLPGVDVDRLGELARDAAYAGVGLFALTAEKIAERGRVIQAEITARTRQLADAVA